MRVMIMQNMKVVVVVEVVEAEVPVHERYTGITRTTVHGFRALLGSRLGVLVATGRAATHCPRGSRLAGCHAAPCGTSGRLGLYPSA